MNRIKKVRAAMMRADAGEGEAGIPDEVLIVKAGWTFAEWNNGERLSFYTDEEAFRSILANADRRQIDIVVDYEHQTAGPERKPRDGLAKAAGWIAPDGLKWDPKRGILASIEWTPAAAEMIKNREYRYYSPVMDVDASTLRPIRIYSLALTNIPAMNDIPPIAASAEGVKSMGGQILKKLGLDENASPEEVEKAIDALISKASGSAPSEDQTAMSAAKMLSFDGVKGKADLVSKVEDLRKKADQDPSDRADVVTLDAHKKALDRIILLEKKATDQAIDHLIADAAKAGKAVEAYKETVRSLFNTSPDEAKKFLDALPVTVKLGENGKPAPSGDGEKSRAKIIASASKEFSDSKELQKTTTRRAYVNCELRTAKLDRLSDDEEKGLK